MDPPSVVADKPAPGHTQEAPVSSAEVGSLFSMQNTILVLPAQLSPLSILSLQIILTLFIKKHPPSPTPAAWNSPLMLATSILQLLLQKPPSCHFLAVLVSFLLCDFDVVIQLNGNFPQKTGYVPPVTFFTCIFRHLIQ